MVVPKRKDGKVRVQMCRRMDVADEVLHLDSKDFAEHDSTTYFDCKLDMS